MITQTYHRNAVYGSWRRALADAESDPEPVVYRLSPLADLQWRAAIEWAGQYEVALHGIGDPTERTLRYFACGEQDVSTGMCETSAQGIAQIASRAADEGLNVLCQVHHHPFAARRSEETWDPDATFSLSAVDYRLLEQLSSDILSDVLEFEETFRNGSVVLRISDATELEMGGQRYSLMDQGSAEVTICDAQMKRFRGVGDVFVGVTGSDGLIHGKVLRTEICSDCTKPVRRTMHPLQIEIYGTNLPEQYQEDAFVPEDWEQLLDDRVSTGWGLWRGRRGRKTSYHYGDCWEPEGGRHDKAPRKTAPTRRHPRATIGRLRGCVRDLERGDVAGCENLHDEIRELAQRLHEMTMEGSEIDDCDGGSPA